jgi:LemA protein
MNKKTTLPLIAVLVFITAMAGIAFILIYNNLVKAEKAVEETKAQIGVVCQRRLDLIPNLVEAVKGYATHERETLEAVAQARSRAQETLQEVVAEKSLTKKQMAKLDASQRQLTNALKSLFALVENYPDIKASTNFLVLQDQLEGAENRIALERQRYNSSLRLYSTKIATFPGNIVAGICGFQVRNDYFEGSNEAEKTIAVKF